MRTPVEMSACNLRDSVHSSMSTDEFRNHLVHLQRKHALPRHHSNDRLTVGQPVYFREEYFDAHHDHRIVCLGLNDGTSENPGASTAHTRPAGSISIKELAEKLGWKPALVSRVLKTRSITAIGSVGPANYFDEERSLAALRAHQPRRPGGRQGQPLEGCNLTTADQFLTALSYQDADITPDLAAELEAELVNGYGLEPKIPAEGSNPAQYDHSAIADAWKKLLVAELHP